EAPAAAGATYALGASQKGMPIALATDQLKVDPKDSFLAKEMKFARRWLYTKGVMTDDEDRNPVETELESFFNDSRTGGHPKADLEVGLNDSKAVILSNLCMEEDRKVHFSEFDTLGSDVTPQQWQATIAKSEQSYVNSLA